MTGDGPAVAAVMGMKTTRTCGKLLWPHSPYNFSQPPLREDFADTIDNVVAAKSLEYENFHWNHSEEYSVAVTIHSNSRSFPADIMHCVLQNVTPGLFILWNRTKLQIDDPSRAMNAQEGYYLSRRALESIGSALARSRSDISAYLGHAPRHTDKTWKGFKAAEWKTWH